MGLTLRYSDDAFDDPDWQKKAWAIKWLANNRCQVCNRKLYPGEVHHNNYDHAGNEIPRDLVALCDLCHALFHWAEADRHGLLKWVQEQRDRLGLLSARVGMFAEWMDRHRKQLVARLDDIEAELITLEAGFKAEREYGEGRRAA
jgi:hypothetical protein